MLTKGIAIFRVSIAPDACWGRVVGEDSSGGACQMCVEICPSIFEKPVANRCARVRSNVRLALYASRIRQAAEGCPVNAIETGVLEDVGRCA